MGNAAGNFITAICAAKTPWTTLTKAQRPACQYSNFPPAVVNTTCIAATSVRERKRSGSTLLIAAAEKRTPGEAGKWSRWSKGKMRGCTKWEKRVGTDGWLLKSSLPPSRLCMPPQIQSGVAWGCGRGRYTRAHSFSKSEQRDALLLRRTFNIWLGQRCWRDTCWVAP